MSLFGANFSASFQRRFFRTEGKKYQCKVTTSRKQPACAKGKTCGVLQESKIVSSGHEKATLTTWQPSSSTRPRVTSDSTSSGSGQSPNSTDPGSPSAISTPPPGLTSHKRPGYFEGPDGFETKKRRISEYRKSDTYRNSAISASNKLIERRDERPPSSVGNKSSSSLSVTSSCRSNDHKRSLPTRRAGPPESYPNKETNNASNNVNNLPVPKINPKSANNLTSSNYNKSSISSATKDRGPATLPTSSSSKSEDFPDYQRLFRTITSSEEKKRYEEVLETDLEECRNLYPQVAKVCQRLDQLIKDRRTELESANLNKVEEIDGQICQEYDNIKKNPSYGVKLRFDYLHEKLTHLKRLIEKYDETNSKLSSAPSSNVREQDSKREPSNPQKNAVLTRVFFHSIQRKKIGIVEISGIEAKQAINRKSIAKINSLRKD